MAAGNCSYISFYYGDNYSRQVNIATYEDVIILNYVIMMDLLAQDSFLLPPTL